jgi:hypothetical protein
MKCSIYLDMLLRKCWVPIQKAAFEPCGKFKLDSAAAYYAFWLRNLATYPHPVRIAALNLGPKTIELGRGWKHCRRRSRMMICASCSPAKLVENRSHINMGRRIVEECVSQPFHAELAAEPAHWLKGLLFFLRDLADLVLGRPPTLQPAAR